MEVRPEAVRQARLDAGLSRARLAGDDLTRGAIYLIETGRSRPSMATLELIAARTGKPLSHFLEPGNSEAAVHLAAGAAEISELERHCLAARYEDAQTLGASLVRRPLEPRWQARAALWLGVAELHLGNLDDARQRLDRSLELLSGVSDPWARANCLAWRAQLALVANDADAPALAQEADRDAQALDPVAWSARVRALLVLGRVRVQAEDWDAARQAFSAALDAARIEADTAQAADWYERLSAAYHSLGDGATSVECSWKAAELYGLRESRVLAVEASVGLARCQLSSGDAQGAREQLEAALAQAEGLALGRGEAQILLGLGAVALGQGELEEAGRLARRAGTAAEAARDRTGAALSRALLGRVATASDDRETAAREFEAAIEQLVATGAMDELVETRMAYAEALEAWGDTAAALGVWKQTMTHWRPALNRAFRA